ncbi:NAD(P)H-binding protein [Planctomonas sp. JC2975]|uniref:NAD(P)H-binding protein n=1 Tax=Planctomonas sp. JC2975 TaxID=2729626 RepID=UPI0014765D45|nr:NAD(P)H-binding protein [Planctomonas sp. JC2975]NNC11295.1 NAD(P)H-binding protein [Planctomonas sp. JC2975]
MTIVITGSTAPFGRGVVEALAERIPVSGLVAATRDPSRAAVLSGRGIRVQHVDFDEPDTAASAFAGADTVLINATFFGVPPATRARRVAAAIDAADRAGVGRVVLTSWPDPEKTTSPLVADFAVSEGALRKRSGSWTILRLGVGIPDALARDVSWARRDGELVAPAADARCAAAAASDLIEATAVVLSQNGHDGQCYELSAARSLDWTQLAALASELEGRDIRYRRVEPDAYDRYLREQGLGDDLVEGLQGLYADFRNGWTGTPHRMLAALLGREPLDPVEAVRRRVPA